MYIREFVKGRFDQFKNEKEELIFQRVREQFDTLCSVGKSDFREKLERSSKQTSKRDTKNLISNKAKAAK